MDDIQSVIVRDAGGRFAPGTRNPVITRDNSRDMLRLRAEKRARLATEGAMRAVTDADLVLRYGNDAALVERAMTLQTIASTPDAGKAAVMSAQYLDKLQGYTDTDDAPAQALDAVTALVRELATFAAAMMPSGGGGSGEGGEGEAYGRVVDGVVDG